MSSLVHSGQEAVVPTARAEKPAGQWTLWSDQRPTDTKAAYRWRIPARPIRGMMLQPEWTENLSLVGMGYFEPQWWPSNTSDWNGYVRTVPDGLEWRLAEEGEQVVVWHGLDLSQDPWTGRPPVVEVSTRWIGAPVFEVERFILRCRFGTTYWSDPAAMILAWNTRSTGGAA